MSGVEERNCAYCNHSFKENQVATPYPVEQGPRVTSFVQWDSNTLFCSLEHLYKHIWDTSTFAKRGNLQRSYGGLSLAMSTYFLIPPNAKIPDKQQLSIHHELEECAGKHISSTSKNCDEFYQVLFETPPLLQEKRQLVPHFMYLKALQEVTQIMELTKPTVNNGSDDCLVNKLICAHPMMTPITTRSVPQSSTNSTIPRRSNFVLPRMAKYANQEFVDKIRRVRSPPDTSIYLPLPSSKINVNSLQTMASIDQIHNLREQSHAMSYHQICLSQSAFQKEFKSSVHEKHALQLQKKSTSIGQEKKRRATQALDDEHHHVTKKFRCNNEEKNDDCTQDDSSNTNERVIVDVEECIMSDDESDSDGGEGDGENLHSDHEIEDGGDTDTETELESNVSNDEETNEENVDDDNEENPENDGDDDASGGSGIDSENDIDIDDMHDEDARSDVDFDDSSHDNNLVDGATEYY